MKKETMIMNTVVPATIAVSSVVLTSRIPFSAETLVGFMTVGAIAGIAAMEYRIGRKA
jgi:hypothetical protein